MTTTTIAAQAPARIASGNRCRPTLLKACWALLLVNGLLLALATSGCGARRCLFEIRDFRDSGVPVTYTETFDEAYYDVDESGNLDLVLRRVSAAENTPGRTITQFIRISSFWRCMPGRTVASSTQINGTVAYVIKTEGLVASFEGVGSVFFSQNRGKDELAGSLDEALLAPVRRGSGSADLFRNARLSGTFSAVRSPRRTVRIINEIERILGPLPPYQPEGGGG